MSKAKASMNWAAREQARRSNERVSQSDTVAWYLNQIQKFPLMTHDQSVQLFKTYCDGEKKSKTIKDKLVVSNLRIVVSIAKKYKNTGIPMEDLYQEGNVGLMKAIDRYDHTRGFMFSTYATWWIKQSIGQHVLKRKKTIRLPAHAHAMQQKMITASEEYRKEFGSEPSAEELSDILGTSERIVKATIQSGRATLSLSSPLSTDDPSGDTLGDTIADVSQGADPFESVAEGELIAIARRVLDQLSPKEAAILRLRFGISEDPTDSVSYPIDEDEMDSIMMKSEGVK